MASRDGHVEATLLPGRAARARRRLRRHATTFVVADLATRRTAAAAASGRGVEHMVCMPHECALSLRNEALTVSLWKHNTVHRVLHGLRRSRRCERFESPDQNWHNVMANLLIRAELMTAAPNQPLAGSLRGQTQLDFQL